MKILYRPLRKKSEIIEYELMKTMLDDIILNNGLDEVFPATIPPNKGIFASTEESGKKFWSVKELTYYYAKKNNELMRITDDDLRQLSE